MNEVKKNEQPSITWKKLFFRRIFVPDNGLEKLKKVENFFLPDRKFFLCLSSSQGKAIILTVLDGGRKKGDRRPETEAGKSKAEGQLISLQLITDSSMS